MEKLQYTATINATPEKVWHTLWDDATYPEWTAVFAPGSRADTDWKKGSQVLFHDGKGDGMISRIVDTRANEYMSFEHLGMVKNGVTDTTSDEVKGWAGAHENYTLTASGGNTELLVEMDCNEEMKTYFEKAWPAAMEKLKEIAEK